MTVQIYASLDSHGCNEVPMNDDWILALRSLALPNTSKTPIVNGLEFHKGH